MKTKLFFAILLISILSLKTEAQFYFEINSGYAKGINNKKHFEKEESYTNKDYYNLDTSNYGQYNLAQGTFIEPKIGYNINNWLSVSVGGYCLLGNNTVNMYYNESDEFITLDFATDTQAKLTESFYNNSFSLHNLYGITSGINISKQIKKIKIDFNAEIMFSKITLNYNSDTIKTVYSTTGNENGYISTKTIYIDKYKYYLTNEINLSFQLGIDIYYSLTDNLFIFGKVAYNNLQFTPNKQIQYYHYSNSRYEYYRSDTHENSEVISNKEETNEIVSEKDIDGHLFGMNTLKFGLGVRYIFNK